MAKFNKRDRVEVLKSSDKGCRGVVTDSDAAGCEVTITSAGPGHNTVKLIGQKIRYRHNELKGI